MGPRQEGERQVTSALPPDAGQQPKVGIGRVPVRRTNRLFSANADVNAHALEWLLSAMKRRLLGYFSDIRTAALQVGSSCWQVRWNQC